MPPDDTSSSITRTLRAAVKIGDSYYTLEETISLPPTASDDHIRQAVATGLRIYEAQRAAVEAQVQDLMAHVGTQPTSSQIREPDAPASEKQRQYMEYLLKELDWPTERLEAFLAERDLRLLTLTKREASEVIDELKGLLAGDDANDLTLASSDERGTSGAQASPGPRPSPTGLVVVTSLDEDLPFDEINPDEGFDDAAVVEQAATTDFMQPIGEKATQRQIRALERLVDERGIDLQGELRARFGDRVLADLSMDEAGQLLSEWQQLPRQLRPRSPVGA